MSAGISFGRPSRLDRSKSLDGGGTDPADLVGAEHHARPKLDHMSLAVKSDTGLALNQAKPGPTSLANLEPPWFNLTLRENSQANLALRELA